MNKHKTELVTPPILHQSKRSAPKTEIAMLILKGLLPTDIAAYAGCDISRVEEVRADLQRRHRGGAQ